MKKTIALIAAGLSMLALTGCGHSTGEETSEYYPETHYVFEQEMPNGEVVNCVWAKSGYGGGLSCDFTNPVVSK
jgi:hypothetical protein